jgi:amidase
VSLRGLGDTLRGLRVALWASDPMCPSSAAVAERVSAVARALAAQGAVVDDAARPAFSAEHSHTVFSALLASAMAARLPDDEFGAAGDTG